MDAGDLPGQGTNAAATAEGDSGRHAWPFEMRLLGNRFFHRDAARWIGLSTAVFGALFVAIFGLAGGAESIPVALGLTAGGSALMLLSVILYAAVMGNRVLVEFEVDEKGARMLARSRRARGLHWTAIVLGAVGRNPAAVGAGLAGVAQERTSIAWDELRAVHRFPADRVIYLRGDVFSRLRLYCRADNYAAVSALIERHGGTSAEPSGEPNASKS